MDRLGACFSSEDLFRKVRHGDAGRARGTKQAAEVPSAAFPGHEDTVDRTIARFERGDNRVHAEQDLGSLVVFALHA
jgi:hypothetical protein